MDKIENFIRENRPELDSLEPSPELWAKIQKRNRSLLQNSHSLRIAATVAVIVGLSAVMFIGGLQYRSVKFASGLKNPQLIETEVYYNGVIKTMLNDAKPALLQNPDLEKELFSDMERLDRICTEIKKDLKDNVANQEVIEAVIQSYRIRIRILEDMLSHLSVADTSKLKNRNNEL
jgi:hypothetical protein